MSIEKIKTVDNKYQGIRAPGVLGNGSSQPSASFGYGQVIPTSINSPLPSPPPSPITPPNTQPMAQPTPIPTPVIPPVSQPATPKAPKKPIPWKKVATIIGSVILFLLILGGAIIVFNTFTSNKDTNKMASRFETIQIPLTDFISSDGLAVIGTRSLVVNGPLQVNDTFTISPSAQPSNAQRGQIYFDATSNELVYFNGSKFVAITGNTDVVRSVNGFSGQINLGTGLAGSDGQISNTGVLSVQGQTGNVSLVAGPGIAIDGTTISNTGVSSFAGARGEITIGAGLAMADNQLQNSGVITATGGTGISIIDDGAGNITISNSGAGTGTVQSPGGTAGRIAKFTGAQTIADSLLSEAGTTVTVNGDLAISGSLTLGSALSVSNGGTGATALANNGVIIGQGSGALTAVTTGTSGLCLQSTAGAPAFSACPGGGGGVVSLNGLTGALTLANATAVGSTVTINDASTSQKGIAQFNSTNFTAAGGTINTIQDINTTATPTFARLSLTSSQANAAMLLVNNTNAGATGNLLDIQLNGASRLAVSPAGALTVAGTVNGQTISSAASLTGTLTVAGAANLNSGATITGTLNANTITPTGAMTIGATGQSLLLQGNGSSSITATNAGSTTSLTFQTPTANVSYRLQSIAAGSYDICSTAGNCAGIGGGVTTVGGTVGTIPKFTAGQVIGDSLLSESGSTMTVNGNLNLTSGNQFTINGSQISSANLANDANLAKLDASQTFTGNTLTFRNGSNSVTAFSVQNAAGNRALTVDTAGAQVVLGQSSAVNGSLVFANSTNTNTTTITATTPTAARSIALPNESGTVCLANSLSCGFASGTASSYIQNQNAGAQSASNFWISGTGRADTALQAPIFDRATAGDLAIGTTNATSITLQQNTILASGKTLTIQGNVAMQPAADSTSAFNIKSSLANNVFTVDTANSRVGIGLGTGVLPTLAGLGLDIRGGLRFSGGNGTYSDVYTTPLGGSINTVINIANFDPGASSQLVAMGLPTGSNANARVLTLLDARSGVHQPTLAVISPDENQIGGFSWEGSNTDFSVKNSSSSGKIITTINSVNRLVVTTSGAGINITPSATALDVVTATTGDIGLRVAGIASQTGDMFQLKTNGGATLTSVGASGATTFQNSADSTSAFRVVNASGSGSVAQFTVDTTNSRVYIGNPVSDTTGALLVLDTKSSAGDPTGVNGSTYYNGSSNRFRCYQNSGWQDCTGFNGKRRVQRADNATLATSSSLTKVAIHTVTLSGLQPSRIYNIQARVPTYSTDDGDKLRIYLHKTSTASAVLDSSTEETQDSGGGDTHNLTIDYDYTTGAAETSVTFVISGNRAFGTGTVNFVAGSDAPYWFRATDVAYTAFDSF